MKHKNLDDLIKNANISHVAIEKNFEILKYDLKITADLLN